MLKALAFALLAFSVSVSSQDDIAQDPFIELPADMKPQIRKSWGYDHCTVATPDELGVQVLICGATYSINWFCFPGVDWYECFSRSLSWDNVESIEAERDAYKALAKRRRAAIQDMEPAIEALRRWLGQCEADTGWIRN